MQLAERAISRFARFLSRALHLKRVEARLRILRNQHLEETKEIAAQASCLSFHATESIRALENDTRRGGVALVTALPPQETGLATFALRLAEENPGKLDLFSSINRLEDLLVLRGRLKGQAVIHPIDLLPEAAALRNYDAIVFAIGNSDHNVPIAHAVRRWSPLIKGTRKCLQIHDPVLFNLGRRTLKDDNTLNLEYRIAYPSLNSSFTSSSEHQLLQMGISGVSALFARSEIDEVLVHSSAAAQIVADDMAHGNWQRPIRKLFHPVFRSTVSDVPRMDFSLARPVVGVFGVPSREKRIDVVTEAIALGFERGTIGTALFAGYGAEKVRSMLPSAYADRVTTVNSPDDILLEQLMRTADVAVQLRVRNLGESSGVIPQLLELGVPVIASRVGSFTEYVGALEFVEPDARAEDVLQAIDTMLGAGKDGVHGAEAYVNQHRSQEFIRRLTDPVPA